MCRTVDSGVRAIQHVRSGMTYALWTPASWMDVQNFRIEERGDISRK